MSTTNLLGASADAKARLKHQICALGLPPEVADDLIGHHTPVNYNKGAIVALQGSPADVLFHVITGLVKVYCPRPDGTRILVKLAGPGDVVGYADYLDSRGDRAQIFEVETLTKSSLALFTREHILKILSALELSVLIQVIERLNTAWSSMAQWFASFLGMSFRERIEIVLKELAEKFGVRDSRGVLLTPELSHADFADMIGSSRPMVTRLMAEMTKQGLLLRQGKRFILCEPSVDNSSTVPECGKSGTLSHSSGAFKSIGSYAASPTAVARKPVKDRAVPVIGIARAPNTRSIAN
jgi:CRP/FNR family transcriptional regulator, cyclic AMP receptor protein